MLDPRPTDPSPSRSGRISWRARLANCGLQSSDWALGLPVLAAASWLAGYEGLAMALALGLPAVMLLSGRRLWRVRSDAPVGSQLGKAEAGALAQRVIDDCILRERATIALLTRIERPPMGGTDWDGEDGEIAMQTLARRISAAMREDDAVFCLGDQTIATVLAPIRRADLDVAMTVADRVQAAVAEPILLGGRSLRVDCRIGLCTTGMAQDRTGAALLRGAQVALREAERHEIGAVRAFTPEVQRQVETGHRLTLQVEKALENGDIRAWFQPQIETRTGRLTGFEALARWYHPDLGVLPPSQFLPAVTASGNDAALGERMLREAIRALDLWDNAGLHVDHVGVNFSLHELRDPRLSERIIWELDRQSVAPGRLAIEILETVTLETAEEVIIRNIRALKEAGLRLEMDDFGTGTAAIGHISKFGVHRIKIDRSFVNGLEYCEDKRRTLSAILSLAAEMGIETLAEGVETEGQAERLTKLGCTHLQGYSIARPMPLDETVGWARARLPAPRDLATLRPLGRA